MKNKNCTSRTDLYQRWVKMKSNKHKGIEVCESWDNEYSNFKAWAEANGYNKGLFLVRKKKSIGFNPDNCMFVKPIIAWRRSRQKLTQRQANMIRKKHADGTESIDSLASHYGVHHVTIRAILQGRTYT